MIRAIIRDALDQERLTMAYDVFRQQTRIEYIANDLETGKELHPDDRFYLAAALRAIANGKDAKVAFRIKGKRGQGTSRKERLKIVNIQRAMGWIVTAIEPIIIEEDDPSEPGLGLTVEEACVEASKHFGLAVETIRHEWATRPEMRKVDFEVFAAPKLK